MSVVQQKNTQLNAHSSIFILSPMPIRCIFLFLCLLCFHNLTAQPTPLSGIINQYAAVTGYDSCSARLSVSDTAGFRPGSEVLLLHLQGAQINTENNASYGTILDLKQAGRIERIRIQSRLAGTLFLERRLRYPVVPGTVAQVVTFPTFDQAIVTDTLRALAWDGEKGGVIALRVTGTLTLNAPIWADKAGFRGGTSYLAPNNNCTWLVPEVGYFYGSGNWRGGVKGEGIALGTAAQELGRGAPANAGGGGNDHNSGGGGGSNAGAGGAGGDNDEPSAFGCDGYYPGLGGKSLGNYTERLFLGGGGGSGHANNSLNSDGGHGGGIILLEAGQINGALPLLSASGERGQTTAGDGAGGGGAGGSIWLQAGSVPANLQLRCVGGNGGNASGGGANRCFGPGGGGGGGALFTNVSNLVAQHTGGTAGIVTNSSGSCNGSTNDAQAGQSGSTFPIFTLETGLPVLTAPSVQGQPLADTLCQGESTVLSFILNGWSGPLQWQYLDGNNWIDLPSETLPQLEVAPSQSRTYRCKVDGAACFQLYSDTVRIEVQKDPLPALLVDMLSSNTIQFYNNSQFYNGQLWNFGDGSSSIEENPLHHYAQNGAYLVTLSVFNECDTLSISQEVLIELPPIAQFSGPAEVVSCNPPFVVFQNESQGALSWNWTFEGGTPSTSTENNPSIQFNNSGTYIITLVVENGAGRDTFQRNLIVQLLPFPVADYSWQDLPGGNNVQFTFTGVDALLYDWDFGDGSTGSSEPNPLHLFPGPGAYAVRLQVQNTCGASILETVVIVSDEGVGTWEEPSVRMSIQPNPATQQVTVGLPEGQGWLRMYNAAGQLCQQQPWSGPGQTLLNLEQIQSGNYWLVLLFGNEVRWAPLIKL